MQLTSTREKFLNLVDNMINLNKISHAFLIEVNNYDDDFECVLEFVKKILSVNEDKNVISSLVDSGNYPDLKIIETDGSVIKKNQLIKLQEDFRSKSFLNNKLIYIIKEADKLNDSSGNTILKFLEEPEDDIIAILVTTNRYKVIETIISRCQILSLQDDSITYDISENVLELLKLMIKKNGLFINYQYILTELMADKNQAKELFGVLEYCLVSYLNYLSNPDGDKFNDEVVKILSSVDVDKIINCISIIEEELKKLEYNVNYKLWLDCIFARLIGG